MNVQDKTIESSVQVKIKRWYWYLLILGLGMVIGGVACIIIL